MNAEDFVNKASLDFGFDKMYNLEFKVPQEVAGGLEVMSQVTMLFNPQTEPKRSKRQIEVVEH
jgi:hypothetical protein